MQIYRAMNAINRQTIDNPRYKDQIFENKLREPVQVDTLCLPTKDEGDLSIPKKYGVVAGWGATKALKPREGLSEADRYSTVLQYSAFTIQSDRLCSNRSALPFNFGQPAFFLAGNCMTIVAFEKSFFS